MKIKCANCGKEINRKPSYVKNTTNICCSQECANNLKKIKYLGDNNPNKKYNFDENLFKNIDTEFKAWLLGWIASDGAIQSDGSISIAIHKKDVEILYMIRNNLCKSLPIKQRKINMVELTFYSKTMVNDICKLLQIEPGKKSDILKFPELQDEKIIFHFIRGYFEGDGSIRRLDDTHRTPECHITSNSVEMLKGLQKYSIVPSSIDYNSMQIRWQGVNALDFLGKIYSNCNFSLLRKKELFYDWCNWNPVLKTNGKHKINKAWFCRTDERAIFPNKSRISDSGYDLTLINKIKQVGDVEFFDTGIKVLPPFGYYFDLVPRSSISKTGYILANNVGIIDRSYVGNIIVPLRKVDKNAEEIQLPCRLVQLILRPIEHFEFEQVDELSDTERGEGGFGSSGIK